MSLPVSLGTLRSLCVSLVVLCLGQAAAAQGFTPDTDLQQKMWDAADPDFKGMAADPKWQGRSSVMLCQSIDYVAAKDPAKPLLLQGFYTRSRSILLDKAAVAAVSQLSLDRLTTEQIDRATGQGVVMSLGIKIVKPDGREQIVSLREAVSNDSPEGQAEPRKLALPDLEPGDIVDMYFCVETLLRPGEWLQMDPVTLPLSDKVPVMKTRLTFTLQGNCYLNVKSVNGAPELKPVQLAGRPGRSYRLVHTDQAEADSGYMAVTARHLPAVKYQLTYATAKGKQQQPTLAGYLGEPEMLKTGFAAADVLRLSDQLLNPAAFNKTDKARLRQLTAFMKQQYGKETNPEVLAREAFYYLRQITFAQGYEEYAMYEVEPAGGLYDQEFVRVLSDYYRSLHLDHDLLFTTHRFASALDDAVMNQELRFLLRVNLKQPVYLSSFYRHSLFGELDYYYEGNEAYAVNALAAPAARKAEKLVLPVASQQANREDLDFKIRFEPGDLSKLHVNYTAAHRGSTRVNEVADNLTAHEYLASCRLSKYQIKTAEESQKSAAVKKQVHEAVVKQKSNDEQLQRNWMKQSYGEKMGITVDSVYTRQIMQAGIWDEEPEVQYSYYFTGSGLTQPAGRNYLFSAGQLIGEEWEPEEAATPRTADAYRWFTYTQHYTISVAIPEGYDVKGLEKLQFDQENTTGGFKSTATRQGSEILITITKWGARNFEPAANWPLIMANQRATLDFSQQKLLFVPLAATVGGQGK